MRQIKKGWTSRSVDLYIVDALDGTPKTGLVFNSSGIDLKYRRNLAAVVSITEVTLAALTTAYTSGGFLEIGNGSYRLDVPDAAFATGVDHVLVFGTITGCIVVPETIQLVDFDPEDAVRMGMTALPNAAAEAAGGLYTRGSGAGQLNQNANGQHDVNVTHAAGTAWASGAITAASIASNAIAAAKIASGAITNAKFASGAIDATAIAADAITAAKIADGAIDAATFAASAITATVIAADAITAAKIADGAIDAATFAAGAINAAAIASDAITDAKVASDVTIASVTGAVGSVTAGVTVTTNNDKTGYGLSAAAVQAIWDALTSALTTVGSIGKKLADWTIGTAQTGDSYPIVNSGTYGNSALKTLLDAKASQTSVDDIPTNSELTTALGTADDAVLAAIAALNNLSQANVRTAVGLATANLDTQLGDLPTNAELTSGFDSADDAVLTAIADLPTNAELGTALTTAVDNLPTNAELATALAAADDAVLAQIALVKALLNDPRGEPGQGAPPVNPDMATKVDWLFKSWRNKKTNDGSTTKLYANDETTVDQKQDTTEAAGTVTKDEWVTGP